MRAIRAAGKKTGGESALAGTTPGIVMPSAAGLATMRQIYGDKGGFGWKHNQIVGAQIIVVPAFEQDAAANGMLKMIAILFAATFGVLMLVLNFLLPRRED